MAPEIESLPVDLERRLVESPFSYPEVGATALDRLPGGYRPLDRYVLLPGGRVRFNRLADTLMGWGVQAAAGLRMQVSSTRVVAGAVLVATLQLGPVPIRTRCRVAYLVDEPGRIGFAYGTLPGHPERGEERFLVELLDDDTVRFGLRAFSRNAGLLARLGGPISHRVQSAVNDRYLRAARSI